MQTVDREQTKVLLDTVHSVGIVEVLPEEEFQDCHLPYAVNVPFGEHFDDAIQRRFTEKSQPIVVYCKDLECQASRKAAERMDELGYEKVYDYQAGKEDWKAAGFPLE